MASADAISDVYNALSKQLLTLKDSSLELRDSQFNLSDIDVKLEEIAASIVATCETSSACLPTYLARLNVTKMFFDVIMKTKVGPNLIPLKKIFFHVFGENSSFFHSLLLSLSSSVAARFATAETVAHFLFVNHCFSNCRECYVQLNAHLRACKQGTIMYLHIIDQLCELREDNVCQSFDQFLFGILCHEFFVSQVWNGCADAQIMLLRIYAKILALPDCDRGRLVMIKNIGLITLNHEKVVQNILTRSKYGDVVKFLIPFPWEDKENIEAIVNACHVILTKFLQEDSCLLLQEKARCFGGAGSDTDAGSSWIEIIKKINTVYRAAAWLPGNPNYLSKTRFDALVHLKAIITVNIAQAEDAESVKRKVDVTSKDLMEMFVEQDDELVEFLLLQLHLFCLTSKCMPDIALGEIGIYHPHKLFIELLHCLSYDSSVLLDWLVSNETMFLQYFVKYLKFLGSTWGAFVDISTQESKVLETVEGSDADSTLNRCISAIMKLKTSVAKLHNSKLFPYSPTPLIKHMQAVETLFRNHTLQC